jgi:hypothetical protein
VEDSGAGFPTAFTCNTQCAGHTKSLLDELLFIAEPRREQEITELAMKISPFQIKPGIAPAIQSLPRISKTPHQPHVRPLQTGVPRASHKHRSQLRVGAHSTKAPGASLHDYGIAADPTLGLRNLRWQGGIVEDDEAG